MEFEETNGSLAIASGMNAVVQAREDLDRAIQLLEGKLSECGGTISSMQLRLVIEAAGMESSRELLKELKFYEFSDGEPTRWHHHGRSFFSHERYEAFLLEQEQKADLAERQHDANGEEADEPSSYRRHRQEEARLGTYVADALQNIYQSDFGPGDDVEYVFDVHNARPGSKYENVDVMAVHWRPGNVVDLVTVEVKLGFTNPLAQQAKNYCRFSNRVWIALPVRGEPLDAAERLREEDPLLFDHIVESGIGILACRPGRGRSYSVFPIHWPRRFIPDKVELHEFVERYRAQFVEARVVRPSGHSQYPVM